MAYHHICRTYNGIIGLNCLKLNMIKSANKLFVNIWQILANVRTTTETTCWRTPLQVAPVGVLT